ncbi:MAG TPA: hypothetical protein VIY08_14025 [Candidatus Nitrosocosmicus sp.]
MICHLFITKSTQPLTINQRAGAPHKFHIIKLHQIINKISKSVLKNFKDLKPTPPKNMVYLSLMLATKLVLILIATHLQVQK